MLILHKFFHYTSFTGTVIILYYIKTKIFFSRRPEVYFINFIKIYYKTRFMVYLNFSTKLQKINS